MGDPIAFFIVILFLKPLLFFILDCFSEGILMGTKTNLFYESCYILSKEIFACHGTSLV